MAKSLSLTQLRDAVTSHSAAFRCRTKLQPAGGDGSKVFPPTYAGGVYATEQRRVNGAVVPCVLLDSVQSQANRLEEGLLVAHEEERLAFPLLEVDFSEFEDIGRITTLDAPHRIADAIFRDSQIDGIDFRETDEGQAFEAANIRNATALYQLCPAALVFGTWDSTGSRGGLGNKFARALVSEIVGVNCVAGVKTSSRIDPLQISSKVPLYAAKKGGWTLDEEQAEQKGGKPVPYQSKAGKGNPSAINHSNVTPDIVTAERSDEPIGGGVTLDHALQTAVLSLPALRRLRFPNGKQQSAERNAAARTVLAALGLAALAEQRQLGYFLRSRCDLVPESAELEVELVRSTGDVETFSLDPESAAKLFTAAVEAAGKAGLSWRLDIEPLQPKPALLDLVRKTREIVAEEGEAD